MYNIRTLLIQFKNELTSKEVPLFRGAVIQALEEDDVLFHNHEGNKSRYGYPKIQYKSIGGKAAILCINEGIDSVAKLFQAGHMTFAIGPKVVKMEVEHTEMKRGNIESTSDTIKYAISNWLALNEENYQKYINASSKEERIAILEAVMKGNILSMCKIFNIEIKEKLKCSFVSIQDPVIKKFKSIKMLSFNAIFEANIWLPDYVGLGKNASTNHGIIVKL